MLRTDMNDANIRTTYPPISSFSKIASARRFSSKASSSLNCAW